MASYAALLSLRPLYGAPALSSRGPGAHTQMRIELAKFEGRLNCRIVSISLVHIHGTVRYKALATLYILYRRFGYGVHALRGRIGAPGLHLRSGSLLLLIVSHFLVENALLVAAQPRKRSVGSA